MARRNRDTQAIENSVERNRLRSSVFRWMVKHHDDFVERWAGQKIDWRTVCSELAELGRTDTKGKPATEGNARETWRQARKHVAAARAAEAAKPPTQVNPSRVPKDWRPPGAPPPSALLPVGQSQAPSRSHSDTMDELRGIRKNPVDKDDGYDPKANKAFLLRLIAQRSGH